MAVDITKKYSYYEYKTAIESSTLSFANWLLNNYNSTNENKWILRKYIVKINFVNHPERGTTEELYKYYLNKYDLRI